MIDKIKSYINRSDFLKNSLILISGTTLAQLLPLIAYPALTRIYTPAQFGLFSLFSSLVFLLGANSGLKYDAAIVLPRKDSDADNILALATVAALTINMLLFVTVPLWDDLVVKAYKNELIRPWLYLLPAANLLLFSVTSLWFYYTRKKKYKLISASKIVRSLSLVTVQIILGLLSIDHGLIWGFFLSYTIGAAYLLSKTNIPEIKRNLRKAKIKALAKRYIQFPKFYLPSSLMNRLSTDLSNYAIPFIYDMATLGLYSLAYRLLAVPISFIGASLSQVFYQESSDHMKTKGNILGVYKSVLKKLFIIFLPIYLIMFFLIKPVFVFIFGEKWVLSGLYLKILTPMLFANSLYNPLSTSFLVLEKQNIYFYSQVVKLIFAAAVYTMAYLKGMPFKETLIIYSGVMTVFYFALLAVNYYVVYRSAKAAN